MLSSYSRVYSKMRFMIFPQVGLVFTVIALSYSFSGVPLGHSAEFKLLKAIRSNQTEKALELIEKKKNPWFFSKKISLKERLDRKDSAGDSALTIAAWNGNAAIVNELLKNGASVDIQDGIGNTALLASVSQGHFEVVQSLLSYRASIGIQNQEGATALTVGIRNKRNEIVQYLLQNGANPNFMPLNEVPALSLALECRQTDLFWALIAAGANLNIEDRRGNTPLHFAVYRSNAQVATWLVTNGGHFGKGPRPSRQGIAWLQTTLLNYLSTIIDPVSEQSTVAHYLYLSKVEGWLGSPFHIEFIKKIRGERLRNLEASIHQGGDIQALPRCLVCGEESTQFYERNTGPANCPCFLCPSCTGNHIYTQMLELGPFVIVCPGPNCQKEVSQSFLRRQGFPEGTIEGFRVHQVKKKYEQTCDWFSCPTANCPNGTYTVKTTGFDCDLCGLTVWSD